MKLQQKHIVFHQDLHNNKPDCEITKGAITYIKHLSLHNYPLSSTTQIQIGYIMLAPYSYHSDPTCINVGHRYNLFSQPIKKFTRCIHLGLLANTERFTGTSRTNLLLCPLTIDTPSRQNHPSLLNVEDSFISLGMSSLINNVSTLIKFLGWTICGNLLGCHRQRFHF